MKHIIALARRPLIFKLYNVSHTITRIEHEDGLITAFACDPPSDTLKELVADSITPENTLKLEELDRAVARANKRRPKKRRPENKSEMATPRKPSD